MLSCFVLQIRNVKLSRDCVHVPVKVSTGSVKHPVTIRDVVSNTKFGNTLASCGEGRPEPLPGCERACNSSQSQHRHLTFRRKETANKISSVRLFPIHSVL